MDNIADKPLDATDARFVLDRVSRSIVPLLIHWTDKQEQPQSEFCTGFLTDYRGTLPWFTAGHVCDVIRTIEWDLDLTVSARWIDRASGDGIVFDLRHVRMLKRYFGDPDVGVVIPSRDAIAKLASNPEVQPISLADLTSNDEFVPHRGYVLGMPKQFRRHVISATAQGVELGVLGTMLVVPVVHPVEWPHPQPSERKAKTPPIYVGLNLEARPGDVELRSIVGMSGGPFVIIGRERTGVPGFRVVGIQSKWFREERIALIEPVELLLWSLDRFVSERA